MPRDAIKKVPQGEERRRRVANHVHRRCSLISRLQQAPIEAGEAGEVAVISDPRTAMLDRQGGKPGVRDMGTRRISVDAQVMKDHPMTIARFDDLTMRLAEEVLTKPEGVLNAAGFLVNAAVCRDPHEAA